MRRECSVDAAATTPVKVEVQAGKTYWWCSCGQSKNQPFCDGSHRGTASVPLQYVAERSGSEWFCVCKRTQTPPFCDGSHNRLLAEASQELGPPQPGQE